jgi:hypothetical protein
MAKKTKTQKYANPVTGEYAELITDAPYDNVDYTQASIVDDLLPKAVAESVARPTDIVNEANEAINKDYPWAVPSMTAFNRALLVELYRIRKALETK